MMKLPLILFFGVLSAQAGDLHPKYGPTATRLHDSHEYIQKSKAPDYWALSPYYAPQENGKSCSVASASMVLNAVRAALSLTAADELVREAGLLERAKIAKWKDAVGPLGKGVALDDLGPWMEAALKEYGFPNAKVKVVHASGSKEDQKRLHEDLVKNEQSAKNFMIANFLQSEFTGDPEGAVGHYAPVAAYDEKKKRVLIFDPDRQYYEPYWVSEEVFSRGMNTMDSSKKVTRGYLFIEH